MIRKEVKIEELNRSELNASESEMLGRAYDAASRAYAPYSRFLVGAALKLENGEVLTASNQENAAYPSGICAERNVVFYAGSNFDATQPESILILALKEGELMEEPAAPCGACLQVLWEYENRHKCKLKVLLAGKEIVWKLEGIDQLLPFAFQSLDPLGK